MGNNLLLRLPVDAQSEVHWLTYEKEGYGKEAGEITIAESGILLSVDQLSQLSDRAAQSRVTILVPGELVTVHSLAVQGRLTNLVKKSLPYRFEDEISSDVDDMHVSILGRQDENLYLGMVEHRWMTLWTDWLNEADIKSRHWMPDTLALPWEDRQCSLMQIDGHWLVRYGRWKVASCDEGWLPLFMENIDSDDVLERVNYTTPDRSLLIPLVSQIAGNPVNLLQESWKPKSQKQGRFKAWKTSIVLAGLVMFSWLGSSMFIAWQLNQQADELQLQSRQVYQTLFPGERVIRLIPQLDRKLKALEVAQQPDKGVLQQLDDLAPVFKQYSDIKPVMINYDDSRQVLRITAEAKTMASFTGMRDSVSSGRMVSLESLEQEGQKITGIVVIKGEGS
ncbi:type II secretion system protein GspL [Endozoicomonas sp. (ex Bugula neritina AB1)]|nr:type II secretion system protein GspL [Endozoicomonas sp. (ex Bugula neritina AB1)]